ncbi:ribosomal protein S18-alanine N-acetyltransferase [Dolosigranulum savutiense]|uniref:Ribosomal protein S18-alanine N-acetyltransferase n=1 Tax=Dolosigranulum savutiense TaxID=3110288 RepID=A0AB74TPB1_9LACT
MKRPLSETIQLTSSRYIINDRTVLAVRMGQLSDITALIKIQEQCYQGRAPWHRQALVNEMVDNPDSLFIVVYDEGYPVAFISAWFRQGECHITNIATIPSYSRQGIATCLINQITDIARSLAITVMTLEVRLSNTSAQRLYQTLGFEADTIRVDYYSDTKEDAVHMVREL